MVGFSISFTVFTFSLHLPLALLTLPLPLTQQSICALPSSSSVWLASSPLPPSPSPLSSTAASPIFLVRLLVLFYMVHLLTDILHVQSALFLAS